METPPPLPTQPKQGSSVVKVLLIVFASVVTLGVLLIVGLLVGGAMMEAPEDAQGVKLSRPASVSFTPQDIEERCRKRGLDYHALARDSRLSDRASEGQQEQLKAKGIKIYRAKIRRKSDVIYIVSVIEAPRDFSSSQAKEVLEMLAPPTPVAVSGRYIYCNAGRPDPRGRGDEVIWMTPQELYESLGR
jgi:hypothetical protein